MSIIYTIEELPEKFNKFGKDMLAVANKHGVQVFGWIAGFSTPDGNTALTSDATDDKLVEHLRIAAALAMGLDPNDARAIHSRIKDED